MDQIVIIVEQKDFDAICAEIDILGRFALDLEFIPEKTFRPVLALLQVATERGVYMIDPLADIQMTELWQKVANDKIKKVLHAAREDLNIIREISRITPNNIFDTQVAAGFLGQGFPVGYKKLLDQILGIQINKSESFTDWLLRPLSELQLQYAFEDVYHLLPLADRLIELLKDKNRLEWVLDECTSFYSQPNLVDGKSYHFTKIKGARALSRQKLAVLEALCNLRFEQARQTNKPLKAILSDITLLELSKKMPLKVESFAEMRGINLEQAKRLGSGIVFAIEKVLASAPENWPSWPNSYVVSDNEALCGDILFAILKAEAYKLQIAPELLATRNEIQNFVNYFKRNNHTEKNLTVLQGWRRDVIGNKLLSILENMQVQLRLNLHMDPSVQIID